MRRWLLTVLGAGGLAAVLALLAWYLTGGSSAETLGMFELAAAVVLLALGVLPLHGEARRSLSPDKYLTGLSTAETHAWIAADKREAREQRWDFLSFILAALPPFAVALVSFAA